MSLPFAHVATRPRSPSWFGDIVIVIFLCAQMLDGAFSPTWG